MLGIDMAFWIGMGVVTLIVVVGCGVAWGISPRKNSDKEKIAPPDAA